MLSWQTYFCKPAALRPANVISNALSVFSSLPDTYPCHTRDCLPSPSGSDHCLTRWQNIRGLFVCLIDEHYSAAPSYNRYDNFVACKKPLNISALAWAFPRPRLNMRPGTKRERFSPAGKYEAWSKASRQEACKLFRTVISSRTQ